MLQKQSVSDLVVEDIKNDILHRRLVPGDKLPTERELAEKYQLSRIPIREALKTLSQMGLVETKHGKGTFIRKPDAAPIVDNFMLNLMVGGQALVDLALLRKIIETLAAREAAEKRTDEDMEEITRLEQECRIEILNACKMEENCFQKADYVFHLAIARASKSHLYLSFLETIEKSLRQHQYYSMQGSGNNMTEILHWHHELVKAIEAHDPDRAAECMDKHLSGVVEKVRQRVSDSSHTL